MEPCPRANRRPKASFSNERAIAGLTLAEIAREAGLGVPQDLRRAKGFVGQLVERALGANAGSRAGPDFRRSASNSRRCRSTPAGARRVDVRVHDPARRVGDIEWEDSPVRAKLPRVLFVPIEGERERPVAERRIGEPFLWSPSAEEEADLKFDWDELSGRIGRGDVESVTGHLGRISRCVRKPRISFAGVARDARAPPSRHCRGVLSARDVHRARRAGAFGLGR